MGSWSLVGNNLGTPPNGILGTTDNNALVVKTNGNERLRVDTNGNVGIGTATPASTLHVNGDVTLNSDSKIVLGSPGFGSVVASVLLESAPPGLAPELRSTATELVFYTNPSVVPIVAHIPGEPPPPPPPGPSERVRIDSKGNVGLGTAQPAATLDVGGGLLHVGGTTTPTTAVQGAYLGWNALTGGTGETDFINNQGLGTGGFAFMNTPPTGSPKTTLMLITGVGNVGIGTVNPGRVLEVAAADSNTGIKITGTTSNRSWLMAVGAVGGDGKLNLYDYGAAASRLTIDTGGNVGIGTTNPGSRLHVAGDVTVTGDVLLTGADCAEHFDVSGDPPEPGTVVVIGEHGVLCESQDAYDKRVAGVVSGAGEYRHGILLDQRPGSEDRIPVALVGKVYCKVDADYSPIDVGDMLTTSLTPGHAMKAMEPAKSFGSVVGKALRPLKLGQGMIPILVALQ